MNFTQITPENFSPYIHDGFRHKWTAEKIWWVMEAAKLKPSVRFIITTDNMTGHAQGDLTIEGIRTTPGYGTYQALLKDHSNPDASWASVWHPIDKLGAIIEVADTFTVFGVKWSALELQRCPAARKDNPYFETYEGIRVRHREQHEREMQVRREAEQARFNQVYG